MYILTYLTVQCTYSLNRLNSFSILERWDVFICIYCYFWFGFKTFEPL